MRQLVFVWNHRNHSSSHHNAFWLTKAGDIFSCGRLPAQDSVLRLLLKSGYFTYGMVYGMVHNPR